MTVAKRDGRTGRAASLGGDTPAITARSLRHSTPPQMAKVELILCSDQPKVLHASPLQLSPEDRAMTYEEMLRYLLKTYPPRDIRGDELMTSIAAEINAV